MRGARRRDRGVALVELALILPVFALLVFGTIDIARAYQQNIRLENAAREGAGFLQIYPNEVDCTGPTPDLMARVAREDIDLPSDPGYLVRAEFDDDDVAGDDFASYTDCETQDVGGADTPVVETGERVRVVVEAEFQLLTPIIGSIVGDPLELTGTAEVVAQG